MRKLFATVAVLTLSNFALLPANAQTNSPGMQMGSMGMMGGGCPMLQMMGPKMMGKGAMGAGKMQGGSMGKGKMQGQGRMGAMAAGRLAFLKSELKITDAQEGTWKGYADAVRARVAVMQGMRQEMMASMETSNAIQRMDARMSGMEAMLAAMKAIKPATEQLYAVLNSEQKKAADKLIGRDCGAM